MNFKIGDIVATKYQATYPTINSNPIVYKKGTRFTISGYNGHYNTYSFEETLMTLPEDWIILKGSKHPLTNIFK